MKRCALADISSNPNPKRQAVDQEDKRVRSHRIATSVTSKYYEPGGALDSQTDSQSYVAEYYNQAGDTMYVGIKEQNQAAKAVSHDNTLAKTCTVKIKREIEEEEENKLPMDLMDESTRTIIDLQTQLRRSQDDLYTVRLKLQTLQRESADCKGSEALANLVIHNRQKVINLKTNDGYIFQDPTNLDKPGTIYRHPLLEEVIMKALFNNGSKSIAFAPRSIIGESDFMPLATIALASAAVECALDEYYKGIPKNIPFKGAVYCKVYRHHIRQLNLWKEHQPESLAAFQREYLTDIKLMALGNNDPAQAVGDRVDVPVARFS